MSAPGSPITYEEALGEYLRERSELALYHASLLSQDFIESGLGPEDMIALHVEALDRVLDTLPRREAMRAMGDAHQFLLEIMITYGIRYREYLEMRVRESLRDAEARADLERQRALDAMRSEREKFDILAMIAHELRTPLTAAMGNLDLASRSLSQGRAEPVERLLGSARDAMGRLSRLSADIVELSRGELPKLEMGPHDLGAIVAQACDWASAAAEEREVALTCEIDERHPVVYGNADALLSVFANLLSNAIRYTPADGRVVVRQGSDNKAAWIEVADTGIGMTPEVQARIFERFFRGAQARSVEARGLGLGLALVQQFVSVHHGTVNVHSSPDQGSIFRVVLPLAETHVEEHQNGG